MTTTAHPAVSRVRRNTVLAILTTHIALSVGLLGDSAGFLAVAIRRALSDDQAFRDAALQLLSMFALMFGIPLSFLALLTGITLTLVTKWSLFRYPWPIAKLCLIVSVILVGAFVLRPVLTGSIQAGDSQLIAGAAWDVAALAVAVGLAVFKPGHRIGRTTT
jgi:uncharacterized membrane protein SirB2